MAVRTCPGCSRTFTPADVRQTTCSQACRQRAYAARRDAAALADYRLPVVEEIPEAPVDFGPIALDLWDVLWSTNRLTPEDYPLVERRCRLEDLYQEVQARVIVDGAVGDDGKPTPAANYLLKLLPAIDALDDRLGLSPRSALLQATKAAAVAKATERDAEQGSRLDAFLRQAEEVAAS